MSLKDSKNQLIQLLADADNKVIALSGKWGTGKSFMWEQVQSASRDDKIKGALYASLFGASSIDQVKLKLIQSTAKYAKDYPGVWAGMEQLLKSGMKVLEGVNKGFGALNDLAAIVAPAMLREKFIVLDDIERKHDKLSIDEILGFIDDLTKRHKSRVILILNDDQLDRLDIWNTLREKIIDQELRLTTTASEAFAIGHELTPSPWSEQIRPAIELCGVVNIRIVCKVIKVVNRILGQRQGLNPAVLTRVIPPTVLLAAIHYKGIEGGPDLDFVLAQGSPGNWGAAPGDDDDSHSSKWRILLNQLGIYSCDEFELLVVEFLRSGLFDVAKLEAVIDRFIAEADVLMAREQYAQFIERSFWEHRLTEEQLLEEAKPVVANANLMDPYMVTAVYDTLSELQGGTDLANQAVDLWVKGFRAKNLQEAELRNFFIRRIHPQIEAEFNALKDKAQANTSVFGACKTIVEQSGWGPREELAMKMATVEDFEKTILNASIKDLQLFMGKMLDLYTNKDVYLAHFGAAMDNFVVACRNISTNPNSSHRLVNLLKILFADAKISSLLDPVGPAPN